MAKAAETKLDKQLEKYLTSLLNDTMKDDKATLTDKMKVVDRVLKHQAIKLKITDSGYGGAFDNGDAGGDDATS